MDISRRGQEGDAPPRKMSHQRPSELRRSTRLGWTLRAERLPAWVCVMGLVLGRCNGRTGNTMTVCRACARIRAGPEHWYCGDDRDTNNSQIDGPVAMND